jgi:hypothetical protein
VARTKAQQKADEDTLARFKTAWGRAHTGHEKRCREYQSRYDAYKGVLDPRDDQYENRVNPWFVFMTIELIASNLVDLLHGRVRPKSATAPQQGAELLEKIIDQYREEDEYQAKQVDWVKQALIVGVSPAKRSWRYEQADRTRGEYAKDLNGIPSFNPVTESTVICDRPTFTPIPANDFLWDPAARSIDNAGYCLYRSHQTMDHLKGMQAAGVYRNVEQVAESRGRGDAGKAEYLKPDTRGTNEVVEYWTCERLVTVVNQTVVVRDDPNPHWHGELPFTVATTLPDLFTVKGISEVETIIDIARALTRSLNQRLDNADFVNNGMVWYDPNQTNPRDLERLVWKPKSLVPRENQNAWGIVESNTQIIDSALKSDEQLLGLMRDVPGASNYLSGATDTNISQNSTATGIQLIQTMAQKRLIAKQDQLAVARRRDGRQEIALVQQFTTRAKALRVDEKDAWSWKAYTPDDIRGEYDYSIEDAQESLNIQQRRDEATVKLTQSLNVLNACIAAQLPWKPNIQREYEDWLEAFDVTDTEAYIVENPPPMMMPMLGGPGIPGGMPGAPPPPGAPATGPPIGAPGSIPNPSMNGQG